MNSSDINKDDELLEFVDEEETTSVEGRNKIKILIVDDDELMHGSTKRTLDNGIFPNTKLEFLSAYSRQNAEQVIYETPDIAVILLDVVMDTDDAGFRVLDYLREMVNNKHTQVILRTGQPGLAPELSCVQQFDICSYLEKSFTTDLRLQTAVLAAYRTFDYSYNMEKKIIERTSELSSVLEKKNMLVRTLCHDLINPITTADAACKKLLQDENSNRKYLDKIQRSLTKQVNLINYIRLSQASEDNKLETAIQPISINKIFSDIRFTFNDKMQKKNISFICKKPNEDIRILVDPIPFENIVVNNIVSNAIKFTPNKGTISVTTNAEDSDWIRLEFHDDGIGIPQNLVNKIFLPNVATSRKGTEGEEGTGFGMPLIKTFITKMGGSIEVCSKDKGEFPNDHGTTFTIIIPRCKE